MSHDAFYEKVAELHREYFVCNAHADLAPEFFLRVHAGETRIINNLALKGRGCCSNKVLQSGFIPFNSALKGGVLNPPRE
jgi:hypothetical protein